MKNSPDNKRIHHLDSLRAIMMLLGVVFHSAITYGTFDHSPSWTLKDIHTTNPGFDIFVWFIHIFRMPVFFAMSGFFGALLFYARSPKKMLRNRLRRVLYPFVVFLFVLWPFIVVAWVFTGDVMSGNCGALVTALGALTNPDILIPQNIFHLWFLNYLVYFVAFSWALAMLMRKLPRFSQLLRKAFEWSFKTGPAAPVLYTIILFFSFYLLGVGDINNNIGFIPNWKSWLLYAEFYFWGWLLFKSKHLLANFLKYDYPLILIAILLFAVNVIFYQSFSHLVHLLINAALKWLFLYGLIGLFMRFFSAENPRMRYISDSSYWVYLIHLPLTAFIPGLLMDLPLPVLLKFTIVVTATTAICYITYHYLVRPTFIGKFLNGRKYPIRLKKIN